MCKQDRKDTPLKKGQKKVSKKRKWSDDPLVSENTGMKVQLSQQGADFVDTAIQDLGVTNAGESAKGQQAESKEEKVDVKAL